MRIRLYREDHRTTDGRLVTNSSWSRDPIPATVEGEGIIGYVAAMTKDDTGWVTGNLVTEVDVIGLAAQAEFVGGDWHIEEMILNGAEFRQVRLGLHPVWEGMVIGHD